MNPESSSSSTTGACFRVTSPCSGSWYSASTHASTSSLVDALRATRFSAHEYT